jgi:ankyrin repeat protein
MRDDVMLEIVRRGHRAVPHLLAHLGDTRRTGHAIHCTSVREWVDRNARTQAPPFEPPGSDRRPSWEAGRPRPGDVTVGDLCFVALGQIVNRQYPVSDGLGKLFMGYTITSPTALPAVHRQVLADWKGLDEASHLASLVNDFLNPDSDERLIGAAERLAYYYPRQLEGLALALLARRTYPVHLANLFIRKHLYSTNDMEKGRELLEGFVKEQGEAAREAVLLALYYDLSILEGREERREPLPDFKDRPRHLLVGLFGRPRSVRGRDLPRYPEVTTDAFKAWFIHTALIHDSSELIDRAVLKLLLTAGDDDYMAQACMARLVGRGHDGPIERRCKRRIKAFGKDEKYEGFLSRLGYTRLHVAAEHGRADLVRQLLAAGASPAARCRDGRTPLHVAAASGYPEVVRLLAASRRGLDIKDGSGRTAAAVAADAEDDDSMLALVAAGCAITDVRVAALAGRADAAGRLLKENPRSVNITGEWKRTALHLAAERGHAAVIAVLLRNGASPEARDFTPGATALHHAAAWGHVEAARALLAGKADVRAAIEHSKEQPVHLAAMNGHRAMIDLLLAHKADLNAPTEYSPSLLHKCVQKDDADMLAYLLKKGARPDIRDEDGPTPLHAALEKRRWDMARILLRHGANAGPPALHLAAWKGCSDTLAELLIRAGAKLDERDKEGETPLYNAAGNARVVRLLLARKAPVNAATNEGATPLHWAAGSGDERVVAMLLRAGARINARTAERKQPLHKAGSPAVVRLLIAQGADVDAQDRYGQTPLFSAVFNAVYLFKLDYLLNGIDTGDFTIVEELLAQKADINHKDNAGQTPLHAAIRIQRVLTHGKVGDKEWKTESAFLDGRSIPLVSLLLKHKADVNAADRSGTTALHMAAGVDDVNLVRLLLSRKADPTLRDRKGRTPLDIAAAKKNLRVAELLRRFTPRKK